MSALVSYKSWKGRSLRMFVITQKDTAELDTRIVQGMGGSEMDAAILFTSEARAVSFLNNSGRSESETVAELDSRASLQYLLRLADESVQQIIVDPTISDNEEGLSEFGVASIAELTASLYDHFSHELHATSTVPVGKQSAFLYHCQRCGAIVQKDSPQTLVCCDQPMVMGARTAT